MAWVEISRENLINEVDLISFLFKLKYLITWQRNKMLDLFICVSSLRLILLLRAERKGVLNLKW